MGLIERIKSALGLGTSRSGPGPDPANRRGTGAESGGGTGRRTDAGGTAGESEAGGTSGTRGASDEGDDHPATSAATRVEPSSTDDTGGSGADDGRASTDESVDVTVEHEPSSEPDDEPSTETGDAVEPATETEDAVKGTDTADDVAPDADLEDIKGIGPTYADRLRAAGIESVGDLASADPAAIAEEADVPRARLEDWIERAKTY